MTYQACDIQAQYEFGVRAIKSDYCEWYNVHELPEVFQCLFNIGGTMSTTETRINIEDPDSLGLSPDEKDKILRTDDTQHTNMEATSGANPPAPLAEVKLLSSAILSLTERLDKLEETPSTKGKGKEKGKSKRSCQEPQSKVPAKKTHQGMLSLHERAKCI